jgi:hypothetical protein
LNRGENFKCSIRRFIVHQNELIAKSQGIPHGSLNKKLLIFGKQDADDFGP